MEWNIIADSSCNIYDLEVPEEQVRFATVPFTIRVDDKDFLDDGNLDLAELVGAMQQCEKISNTACPAPGDWVREFEKPGNVIAITISSNLSGSYNSACVARDMILDRDPDRNIYVIDSLSTGPEMVMAIRKMCALIREGKGFDDVVSETLAYLEKTHIIFALSSYDNLVKNGRVGKLKGFLANKLGFIGVGIGSETGTIAIKGIVRGKKKAVELIIQDMLERGIPKKDIVISHCLNEEFAEKVKEAVQTRWKGTNVTVMPTRGLCGYYAEHKGLIIGY